MLDRLLPPSVVTIELVDHEAPEPLWPEEEALLGGAVEKRRHEFTAGRTCARRALTQLGVPPAPLLWGANREPSWPDGVVGSITHCSGYCASAVAHSRNVVSLGIDAEPNRPLPADVVDLVARASERAWIEANPGQACDTLLFSAKECVFKAWFPLTGRSLDFEEAEVTFDEGSGTFVARLLVPGPVVGCSRIDRFEGHFVRGDDLLLTAIAVIPALHSRDVFDDAFAPAR